MRTLAGLLLTCIVFWASCTKDQKLTCIQQKIVEFRMQPLTCKEGAKVKEYTFQQRTVYHFEHGYCIDDAAYPVYDEYCNFLGYTGGFEGQTIVNGEDFSNAVYIKTIWEN